MEYAPTEELFCNPVHAYTQALLSAVPVPDLDHKRERIILRGEITSPIDPKPGCRFAPRCQNCNGTCAQEEMCLRQVSPGHYVACSRCG